LNTHDIYRDWFAVQQAGETEVSVDTDTFNRADVVVLRPEGVGVAVVIEVKLLTNGAVSSHLHMAQGQTYNYRSDLALKLGCSPDAIATHWLFVLGGSPSDRQKQRRRLALEQQKNRLDHITLHVTDACPDLPTGYRIGGVCFDRPDGPNNVKAQIADHIRQIGSDFAWANYFSPAHSQFLNALAERWYACHHGRRDRALYRQRHRHLTLQSSEGGGTRILVIGPDGKRHCQPLTSWGRAAADYWLRLEHYNWITAAHLAPATIAPSP